MILQDCGRFSCSGRQRRSRFRLLRLLKWLLNWWLLLRYLLCTCPSFRSILVIYTCIKRFNFNQQITLLGLLLHRLLLLGLLGWLLNWRLLRGGPPLVNLLVWCLCAPLAHLWLRLACTSTGQTITRAQLVYLSYLEEAVTGFVDRSIYLAVVKLVHRSAVLVAPNCLMEGGERFVAVKEPHPNG